MTGRYHQKTPIGRSSWAANAAVDAFLGDVVEVCRRHGLSISHEDGHGSFLVEKFDEGLASWLDNASIGPSIPNPAIETLRCDSSAS